ncbi:MAG: hypothetical protein Q4F00_05570 [bacterium]|nr:hypothetical protein [bacterium]
MTIKVNLLPTERKKIAFDPLAGILVVLCIACAVGCVFFGQSLQTQINDQENEISKTQAKIKEIEQNLPVIDKLKSDIAKLEDEIKVVESLVYDPVRYGNLLGEVGRVLPSNVYLSSLSVEPSTTSVMINGTAKNTGGTGPLATIAGLMSKMNNSEIFVDASLASTSQTGNETDGYGFAFSIEARYNPDAAAGLIENKKVADAKTSADAINS